MRAAVTQGAQRSDCPVEARPTVLILGSPAPSHLPERAILEPLAEVVEVVPENWTGG